MTQTANPFVYGEVVRGKHFCNRKVELRELLGEIRAGQSVGMVTRIQPAGEIVRELAQEAVQVLRQCADLAYAEVKES